MYAGSKFGGTGGTPASRSTSQDDTRRGTGVAGNERT